MARKGKVRIDRIIILTLASILVLFVLGFGVYKLFGLLFNDTDNTDIDHKTPVTETTTGVKIKCNDYAVYVDENDNLGFDFIIAELELTADSPISFELKNLKKATDNETLDNVSEYINKLDMAGYSLNKLGISVNGIESKENTTTAKIFIPYSTTSSTLRVFNTNDATKLEFDLTINNFPATTLKLSGDDTQIEVGTNKVGISKYYISSSMLHNGERYPVASTVKVYTFEINVIEAQESAYIEDAIYIEDGTDKEIHCYGKEYNAIDCENVIEKKLVEGVSGGLFFDVISEDNEMHEGTLLIKFSNEDNWVEIINE